MRYYASAPGKVILAGEHAVVYGYPALVAALNLRSTACVETVESREIEVISDRWGRALFPLEGSREEHELFPVALVARKLLSESRAALGLRIMLSSEIPAGAGLGSSASTFVATASALCAALGLEPDLGGIREAAMEGERRVHWNPSGVDVEVALNGGVLLYRRGQAPERALLSSPLRLVLGFSGVPKRTGDMVKVVAEFSKQSPEIFSVCMESIAGIATRLAHSLPRGDLEESGWLMNVNHLLLTILGLSTAQLDGMVAACLSSGALGAKLTGGGGGGCIVCLSRPGEEERVSEAIRGRGGEPLVAEVSLEGVKTWREG